MRLQLIKDIFLFFARFPDKEGVLELFSQGESDLSLYVEWMDAVRQLPDESLLPEIKHYIFGSNPQAVAERINAINDCFMLIDYGQITSERGKIGDCQDAFTIIVTIAFPYLKGKGDLIEMANRSEMALDMISKFRNKLMNEEKRIPWLRQAMAEHELMPWEASAAMPSTGWSIILERRQADMLKLKDIK